MVLQRPRGCEQRDQRGHQGRRRCATWGAMA